MKKNTSPYSVKRNVYMAIADNMHATGVMHNIFFCEFKKYCDWQKVNEVPGSLIVSCNELQDNTYQIDVVFRVSFSDPENRVELDVFRERDIILKYDSGGGKTKVAGTKMYPLRIAISEPEGFDGYEIKLTGIQNRPESFIQAG